LTPGLERRVHAYVNGLVQGVFYRASTRDQAKRLGLAGWVRNLPDGRVEFLAEGRSEAIEDLLRWCRQGPPGSRVDEVESLDEMPTGEFGDFVIRYRY
jgi:acylphosphatase